MSGLLTPSGRSPARSAWQEREDGLPSVTSRPGEPTWEIAERMYPRQGDWTEEEYLRVRSLSDRTVEFVGGFLDFHGEVRRASAPGEPTWEVAEFAYPRQGAWTEEEYFEVEAACEGTVEFVDGVLDFHAMPDFVHADLHHFLFKLFDGFCEATGAGFVRSGQLTVRGLPANRNREPDLLVLKPQTQRGRGYPSPDDVLIVVEVVSPDRNSVERDYVTKRAEYAAGRIGEYWIVDATDPADPRVTVLTLSDGQDSTRYREHGVFRPGDEATSRTWPSLTCDVAALFAAAEE
ncbi:Uma2 family endonuclease [Alienimonas sp. DA493]|uniref:Uma2 family endonuclease n=1 Tax=Alienimonas sp. DA493 TaxID=3373605 RepID=UPI0037549103